MRSSRWRIWKRNTRFFFSQLVKNGFSNSCKIEPGTSHPCLWPKSPGIGNDYSAYRRRKTPSSRILINVGWSVTRVVIFVKITDMKIWCKAGGGGTARICFHVSVTSSMLNNIFVDEDHRATCQGDVSISTGARCRTLMDFMYRDNDGSFIELDWTWGFVAVDEKFGQF